MICKQMGKEDIDASPGTRRAKDGIRFFVFACCRAFVELNGGDRALAIADFEVINALNERLCLPSNRIGAIKALWIFPSSKVIGDRPSERF